MEKIFDQLVEDQRNRMLRFAREILPQLTSDDILQPNDFPELENQPAFRYEEGVLEGLLTARMAYLAARSEGAVLQCQLNI